MLIQMMQVGVLRALLTFDRIVDQNIEPVRIALSIHDREKLLIVKDYDAVNRFTEGVEEPLCCFTDGAIRCRTGRSGIESVFVHSSARPSSARL